MERFGIGVGVVGHTLATRTDRSSVRNSTQMFWVWQKRRKQLRSVKKGFLDKEKETEKEDAYVPGGF